MPPTSIAPPTPPTTPPMIFLLDLLRPELPEDPPLTRLGAIVEVAVPTVVATVRLEVWTEVNEIPSDTPTTVVTYLWTSEETMADVMTVDLESVERLMVDASVPVPTTTMLEEVPEPVEAAILEVTRLEAPELVVEAPALLEVEDTTEDVLAAAADEAEVVDCSLEVSLGVSLDVV